MRTSRVPDDELVEQAFVLTGMRTRHELVILALRELARQRSRRNLFALAGKASLRPDFDHKALRRLSDNPD